MLKRSLNVKLYFVRLLVVAAKTQLKCAFVNTLNLLFEHFPVYKLMRLQITCRR